MRLKIPTKLSNFLTQFLTLQRGVSNRLLKLQPVYDHRFSFAEIKSAYASTEDAFEKGNFVLSAELADEGSNCKACR